MNAPLTELDLTRLDPTLGRTPDPTSPAAEALLARVLATPRTPADPESRTTTSGQRSVRLRRRWVLVGAAAAVTAAGLVAAQVASDEGTPQAFATWTAEPTPLTAEQAATAEADCLALMTDPDGKPLGGPRTAGLADLRGGYLSALAVTEEGVATCLSADPSLHDPVLGEETGMGAWAPADSVPEPRRDGTTVVWGGGLRTAEGSYTQAFGRAGADVTSVVLTDADGRRVAATLGDGWFTAWWPSWPTSSLTVRTTLADGRTTERVLHRGEH
ncbi:hypothetical protein ACUN7V_15315 [Quadrisphaera oryzae]|uniref:hypothetical protein n=1 Tax=Quadrisphaera TaxID=317661 RepID=UPI0016447971|nr:hypothetical protein [Quadrisphaera sp. RL12-1S]MBC3760582.1 hypothetical protein [Quadrisphaera sp. RL12-1S]